MKNIKKYKGKYFCKVCMSFVNVNEGHCASCYKPYYNEDYKLSDKIIELIKKLKIKDIKYGKKILELKRKGLIK